MPDAHRRFGLKSALDYLVREKLLSFAEAAEQHSDFAAELVDGVSLTLPVSCDLFDDVTVRSIRTL